MTAIAAQQPRDFDIEVARGTIPGYRNIGITGVNPIVGSVFADVWDVGGNFVFPTAGETWEVVSDSASDTLLGTGARKVIISGLDDSFVEQTEVVEMNGTTPVVTVRTDWFRIRAVLTIDSGSTQTNEGTIDIRVSGGGDPRSRIRLDVEGLGLSNTFNAFFTVPLGKTLFIKSAQVLIPKNEDVIIRNKFKAFGSNTFLTGGDAPVYQNTAVSDFTTVAVLPEKTDLVSTVKSTNTAVSVAILLQGKLVDGASSTMSTF